MNVRVRKKEFYIRVEIKRFFSLNSYQICLKNLFYNVYKKKLFSNEEERHELY